MQSLDGPTPLRAFISINLWQWHVVANIYPGFALNAKYINMDEHILVGGFNHIEKYESQWEGLFPYIMEK